MTAFIAFVLAAVGYPVTQPEYKAVEHGWSRHHVEQNFDNPGNVSKSWKHHGVRYLKKHYIGTDSNWPEPTKVHTYMFYRHTSKGWREYKKTCNPQFDTSIWKCS